jgi:oligopeptide/dipeptide ABC transporter ATP-binding protein
MSDVLLAVTDLRTWFHTRRGIAKAVDGVDLVVREGRTLCVVGESGSGKSVTALSAMGLVDAPGEIEPGSRIVFDGTDITGWSDRRMRKVRGRGMAMIFQEPMTALNPVRTAGDQIGEAVGLHEGLRGKGRRVRVVELMRLVGIADPERRASDYPHQLSGGMRQRVMIAAALAGNPKLLIADEPTTALDVTIQAQILDLLRSLQERFGMAILMITHDLGVVAEVADDVAVMYAGKVVETGPARVVLGDPRHPYTRGLMASVSRVGMETEELFSIPGTVPNSTAWPAGCRFAARCGHAIDRCHVELPQLEGTAEHASACHVLKIARLDLDAPVPATEVL